MLREFVIENGNVMQYLEIGKNSFEMKNDSQILCSFWSHSQKSKSKPKIKPKIKNGAVVTLNVGKT